MTKSLTEMAAEIAAAQASHAPMSADEIGLFLQKIFDALREIRGREEADEGDGNGSRRSFVLRKRF